MGNKKILKYMLPNHRILYIQVSVLEKFHKYIQKNFIDYESGGYVLGYENINTNSIIVDSVTVPQKYDEKSRLNFSIRDNKHEKIIAKESTNSSYFLGTWHTHPQDYVLPSTLDWIDWKKSVRNELPAARYMIFMIVGRKEIGVWTGDRYTKIISRIKEVLINEKM